MHLVDVLTIVCTGLMIGNELAVSLFVNPAVWQLEESAQAQALSLLARSLGKAMPFWYAACLVLLIVEAYLHRQGSTLPLIVAAIAIWIAVIIYTVVALVPINKRIALLPAGSLPVRWRQDHERWDKLHRLRILLLTAALSFLAYGLVSAGAPAQLALR
jgi:uncharacterized membrane protein